MRLFQHVAFIGNYPPRRCGIATFTHDLHRSISAARPDLESSVVAMADPGGVNSYPPTVRLQIREELPADYVEAANFLNTAPVDVVSLQHEYGIFGGEAGSHIAELLSRLAMPVVTTLHTVLPEPSPIQREAMRRVVDVSAKIVVMAEKGHELLRSVYSVPADKIEIIRHGVPDVPFLETHQAKAKFGFGGKTVILTFGLLSPNKGIETMIDAMPGIIRSCPDAIYIVLGATHPNLVRRDGETYRNSLTARVSELGIKDHVVFFDQFVDQATLLDFIAMCDIYVTPYLNEAQMTSGTLAYSFGLGKAVVSTPYWHARELLGGGRGILVPFGDAKAMSGEIAGLLTNDIRRHSMRKHAYATSRSMTWAQSAKQYLAIFQTACEDARAKRAGLSHPGAGRKGRALPRMRLEHFRSLCDSTGMLQHSIHSVPDRTHGYCIDDNARALLFANILQSAGEAQLPDNLIARFAAFIQHAWNPQTRRFRNFMSYERRWLEDFGSEDSHGRTLWALGNCAYTDTDPSRRRWAALLFASALPVVAEFTSPRAWAFTLLGLDAYCKLVGDDAVASRMRTLLADRLMSMFSAVETTDWPWFEDVLAYDNARLSQALIQSGLTTQTPRYVEVGLRSLRWLMTQQTTPSGRFRPVGTDSFGGIRQKPKAFDQQPVEASAMISACIAASRADGSPEWAAEAIGAFGWFLGENDLNTALIDIDTGSCSDGLHPDRPNENKGAESVLSYLLGLVELQEFVRTAKPDQRNAPSPLEGNIATRPIVQRTTQGGQIVSIPISKSPGAVSPPGSGEGRHQTL